LNVFSLKVVAIPNDHWLLVKWLQKLDYEVEFKRKQAAQAERDHANRNPKSTGRLLAVQGAIFISLGPARAGGF
jgi:hypothetical protein